MITLIETKIKNSFDTLKEKFSWKNKMQAIKIEKIVVSTGIGRIRKDKQKIDLIQNRLLLITGQKPSFRKAKKSIAAFKLREGEIIGYITTLHKKNMHEFLDRLINVALPRMRDFRGISRDSVDEMGNLTIGISEHTIFIEVPDENLTDVFGLSVTIVTNAKTKEEAISFFETISIPFVK